MIILRIYFRRLISTWFLDIWLQLDQASRFLTLKGAEPNQLPLNVLNKDSKVNPINLSELIPEVLQTDTPSLIHYPPNEIANSLRQQCFDLFIEICFGNSQRLSNLLHLTPLLRRIQSIRMEKLQIGTCPANHLARIFFYEVRLSLFLLLLFPSPRLSLSLILFIFIIFPSN